MRNYFKINFIFLTNFFIRLSYKSLEFHMAKANLLKNQKNNKSVTESYSNKKNNKTKSTKEAIVEEQLNATCSSKKLSARFKKEIKAILLNTREEILKDIAKIMKSESDHLKYDVGDIYDDAANDRERNLSLLRSAGRVGGAVVRLLGVVVRHFRTKTNY